MSSNSNIRLSLAAIAEQLGATVEGDSTTTITGVAPIEKAGPRDLSFVANDRYKKFIETTRAGALVLDPDTPCSRVPVIRHRYPYYAFAEIVDLLHPDRPFVQPGVHRAAVIADTARIDPSAGVGPLCHIGDNATIGKGTQLISSVYVGNDVSLGENCLIYPGVTILDGSIVGNNVTIHASTVIGSDGFGYAEYDQGLKKVKQIGWVRIADDVEIGSNCSVDRGALGPTKIGRGTKIDNLVQVAHNVEIGANCIIVAQVGIAGSTRIGDGVILAGQAGIVGHLNLSDGVRVGAQSGVHKSLAPGTTVLGSPARDIRAAAKIEAALTHLPELLKRVRKLENQQDK